MLGEQTTKHWRSDIKPRFLGGEAGIGKLIDSLRGRGFKVIAPTVIDGVIKLAQVESVDELPIGITQTQKPGSYSLRKRNDQAIFGYVVAANSPKEFLFPARDKVWSLTRQNGRIELIKSADASDEQPLAFLGVKGCEVAAIRIQDRVFSGRKNQDPRYATRRERSFVIGVNCTVSSSTCFCTSMGTGPEVGSEVDIAITEVLSGDEHQLIATGESAPGDEILNEIVAQPASDSQIETAKKAVARTAGKIEKKLQDADLRTELKAAREGKIWDQIAERCLACGNCTMVCPTCFCSDFKDVGELDGSKMEKVRRWDTCFSSEYSFIAGASARTTTSSKYRHWMTHKLATWIDQFGTQGCVGCGRCTVWCPAGIDFAAEASRISGAFAIIGSAGERK